MLTELKLMVNIKPYKLFLEFKKLEIDATQTNNISKLFTKAEDKLKTQ